MIVPVAKLPAGLATLARALPPAALSDGLHAALGPGIAGARRSPGWCSACGPWRRPWPPRSPSAGSSGASPLPSARELAMR